MLTPARIAHCGPFDFLLLHGLNYLRSQPGVAENLERQPDGSRHQLVVPFVEKGLLLAQLSEDDRICPFLHGRDRPPPRATPT